MDTDYAAAGFSTLGLAWLVNPVYWPALQGTAIAAAIDWLGAIGLVPGGSYYVPLGVAYLTAGAVGSWYAGAGVDPRRLRPIAAAGVVTMVVVTLVAITLPRGTASLTVIALALGTGPVLLALPLGMTRDRAQRIRTIAAAGGLVVPWLGWVAYNVGLPPVGPAGTLAYLSVGLLVVLDAVWGLPVFWLGTRLRPN